MPTLPASDRHFHTTRWTLVMAASGEGPTGEQALSDLCRLYYQPLFAYARTQCVSEADAEDAVQSFFQFLLERRLWERADSQRGRLRTFFLACFKNLLVDRLGARHALKRGGGASHVSLDSLADADLAKAGAVDLNSPEHLFFRQWALNLVALSMADVEAAWQAKGCAELFRNLSSYITRELDAEGSVAVADGVGLSATNVRVSASRLRREFKDAFLNRIADTVACPTATNVKSEVDALYAVLQAHT